LEIKTEKKLISLLIFSLFDIRILIKIYEDKWCDKKGITYLVEINVSIKIKPQGQKGVKMIIDLKNGSFPD
jgi:hypothetical protein